MNTASDETPVDFVQYQKPTLWMRLRGNTSVLVGGCVLGILVAVSIAAPLLGTIDPTLFDASNRDLLPGEEGDITDLEGTVTKHTWPLDHPVAAAWIYSIALVALGWIIAQRRYRARTTD